MTDSNDLQVRKLLPCLMLALNVALWLNEIHLTAAWLETCPMAL